MNHRARKGPSRGAEGSGGNVLFTLGLISVVALLIVGFIMTQGGMGNISKGNPLSTIYLQATPAPTPVPTAVAATESFTVAASELARVKGEFEARLLQEKEASDKRIEEMKAQYLNQISDLQLRIKILTSENERLRGAH